MELSNVNNYFTEVSGRQLPCFMEKINYRNRIFELYEQFAVENLLLEIPSNFSRKASQLLEDLPLWALSPILNEMYRTSILSS